LAGKDAVEENNKNHVKREERRTSKQGILAEILAKACWKGDSLDKEKGKGSSAV